MAGSTAPVHSPRQERRRRSRALMVLARLAVLAVGLFLLWRICVLALCLGPFPVRKVKVVGARHLPPKAVLAIASLPPGSNIFRVRTRAIRRRLEMHPLVERARVRRLPGGTLVIRVQERPVAAFIPTKGEPLFVDRAGRAFECMGCSADGLAELAGVTEGAGSRPFVEHALAALEALSEAGLPCTRMTVAECGALEATLPGGVLLKLGLPENLAEKATKARQALGGLDQNNVEYLDVSAPTAIVWKPRRGSDEQVQ